MVLFLFTEPIIWLENVLLINLVRIKDRAQIQPAFLRLKSIILIPE